MSVTELMILGLIVSGFAIFMITLLSVSLYTSAGKHEALLPISVTPARRSDAVGTRGPAAISRG